MTTSEQPAPAFDYCEGYPVRFRRGRRRAIVGAIGCLAPFLVASLVGLTCASYGFLEAPRALAVTRLVGLLVLSSLFGFWLWEGLCVARSTTIVPYFERRVGDIHTFGSGSEVAKHCQELDEFSLRLGLTPLSAFGFDDEYFGEKLTWHSAEIGLVTVVGLLQFFRENDDRTVSSNGQLIRELVAIEDALRKAAEHGIKFCLLLRIGNVTNAMEWEQRKGTCF